MEEQKWVSNLVLVRHGESTRNRAKAQAEAEKSETYGRDERDMDVELADDRAKKRASACPSTSGSPSTAPSRLPTAERSKRQTSCSPAKVVQSRRFLRSASARRSSASSTV